MKIVGAEGLTRDQIHREVLQGARFVVFQYCFSLVVMSAKRPSDIYYIRPTESAIVKGLTFTALSLLAGWWGIPWGPIYTVQSVWINSFGGRDVTPEVIGSGDSATSEKK